MAFRIFLLLSLLTYELCLPLVIIFTAVAAILQWQSYTPAKVLARSAIYTLPSLIAVCLIVFYRAYLLPALGLGLKYRTIFDAANFVHVINNGIKVSVSPYALSFFSKLAQNFLSGDFNVFHFIVLLFVTGTLISAGWILAESNTQRSRRSASQLAIGLGVLLLVSAYVIFGLTPDYMPVLDTGINRVNAASSIGAALITTGLLGWLSSFIKTSLKQTQSVVLACLFIPLVLLFVLANWQFAGPWVVSWKSQQQIMTLIKKRAAQIHSGDTIILAGIPRYTMWAPVFDGVWDFQSELRVVLNRSDINGGVLSDRLVITPAALEDRFQAYLCASYPFKQMFVLVPSPEKWIAIHSSSDLLVLAKKYDITIIQSPDKTTPIQKDNGRYSNSI